MVDFPILEEVKNFIYTNLETIFLIIVPFAALIGWIAERLNKKLTHIEITATNIIEELKDELDEKDRRFDRHVREFTDFRIRVTKDVGILRALYTKQFDIDEYTNNVENDSDIDNESESKNNSSVRKRKKK